VVLKSFAKVNLFLQICNLRSDNYHNIRTIFERISLYDTITIKLRRDKKITVTSDLKCVPRDSYNLAYRGAKILQERYKVTLGADIKITKRIPVAAGLGGGSSDAASAIMGLNQMWKLGLKSEQLAHIGSSVGSDVPFFLYDCPFAEGRGRGEQIIPISGLGSTKLLHVLVVPEIKVSTPLIYKTWDKSKKARLTRAKYNVKLLLLAISQNHLLAAGRLLFNSLENITAELYPEVKRVKEAFLRCGVGSVLMSGSGPAVFGLVSSRKEALAVSRRIRKIRGSWRIFVSRTV